MVSFQFTPLLWTSNGGIHHGRNTIFHRFEKKYLLDYRDYRRLQRLLSEEMAEDAYGLHTITSVYFDTDAFDIIRASVQQPLFKEKLRLRWYGIPKPEEPVFLELKRKYRGMVYKRRVPVIPRGAAACCGTGSRCWSRARSAKEVDWFIRRYHPTPQTPAGIRPGGAAKHSGRRAAHHV